MEDVDNRIAAIQALGAAEDGFEYMDGREDAAAHYAQLAIGHALLHLGDIASKMQDDVGHALLRVGETLDRMQDDLHAVDARLQQIGAHLEGNA